MIVKEFIDMCPMILDVTMIDYDSGKKMRIGTSSFAPGSKILGYEVKSWGVIDGRMIIGYRRR